MEIHIILQETRDGEANILGGKYYKSKEAGCSALRNFLKKDLTENEFLMVCKHYEWDFLEGKAGDEEDQYYVIQLTEG